MFDAQPSAKRPPLYRSSFEHDNCGIGACVNIKGQKSRATVENALRIVENLEHRAGKDAEGKTGDGVGILTQVSHKFFSKVTNTLGFSIGKEREYGVGMFFFPQDELQRNQAKKMFEIIVEKEGMEFLGWREVPTYPSVLGHKAIECMPYIMQAFIKKPDNVAKGLDFDDVTLVGVVNADNSLYDESYNSAERCFDLITQVVGRSGRRDGNGKAVIQTINPYNQTLEYAADQDYKSFYNNEIELRRLLIYPPYCDIISASFIGENENKVAMCAKKFFELLIEENENFKQKIIVLGPSAAKIAKLNNCYRYRLSVKCKNSKNIRNMFNVIQKNISKIKEYKDVSVSLDLNPYDLN